MMYETELSRRGLMAGLGAVAGAAALGSGCGAKAKEPMRGKRAPHPPTPDAALALLMAGNERYRRGQLELRDYSPVGERIASAQKPFAAIIACADSRISPPLIFDVDNGNLFLSRVAGNSIDVATLGSTEYAVAVLGVKLVMVLGHSDCGAVKAAIEVAKGTKSYPASKYGAIGAFVDAILPPIKSLPTAQRTLESATAANASAQAKSIAAKGPIIKPAVDAGKIRVVSAVYDIATGKVSL
jgi:carbonic anhydrase